MTLDPGPFLRGIPFIHPKTFVIATRDSGYKSLSAAVAELVDNSIDAHASRIDIIVGIDREGSSPGRVVVLDNGRGLASRDIPKALQFGGTQDFDARGRLGRFGMGLPNASLSQARCVELYSWSDGRIRVAKLDIDDIIAGKQSGLASARLTRLPTWLESFREIHRTAVVWSKCDRLSGSQPRKHVASLMADLGRIYRNRIGPRLRIDLNGQPVLPVDPVRIVPQPSAGMVTLLPPLSIPFRTALQHRAGQLEIQFAVLPVECWSVLPNAVKNHYRIAKWGGVSVMREDREIAYGWYFLAGKRRENYDDWWRCEVRFPASLDEAFGVTNTKQGIRPTPELVDVLGPVIAAQAHQLNRQVRRRFEALRDGARVAERRAGLRDSRLTPVPVAGKPRRSTGLRTGGHTYRVETEESASRSFLRAVTRAGTTTVYINRLHPFYTMLYVVACASPSLSIAMNAFLLAMGRASSDFAGHASAQFIERLSDLSALFMDRK